MQGSPGMRIAFPRALTPQMSALFITTFHHNFSSQLAITTCHHNLPSQLVITTCHHNLSSQSDSPFGSASGSTVRRCDPRKGHAIHCGSRLALATQSQSECHRMSDGG